MVVSWMEFLTALAVGLASALALVVVMHVAVRLLARRSVWARALLRRARVPFRLFVLAATLSAVVAYARPEDLDESWWERVALVVRLFTIGSGAWLLAAALIFLEDLGLHRYRTDVADNRVARRVKTQGLIIRRLTVALVVVVALGAALYSFPGVKAIGASLLASAGVLSIVAAVAAQSTLANLIAGVQVAFSDAIRLDDVVIVEEEWGWIEEITLSYVVVRLWDDRRMVLPSTYFTKTPFQNWTRRNSELLGSVELDVDWRVDVAAMRAELESVLQGTDLWDGRAKVLQVTDAVGGLVRVRMLVTATDAATLFDLRCHVREELVRWVQVHDQDGLPRQRVELVEHQERRSRHPRDADRPGLFSGDAAGEERAARFRGGEQDTAPGEAEAEAHGDTGGTAGDRP
ncbi:MAG: mechanosensitive ion channel domain-containing protein [Nocardioides sp.]